jgi:hypothetical protein
MSRATSHINLRALIRPGTAAALVAGNLGVIAAARLEAVRR